MTDDKQAAPGEGFAFDEQSERVFQDTVGRYPTKMAALLPTLWIAQKQHGYLTNAIMEYVAGRLDLSPVHVFSVAEFYTMYHKSPPGKFHIQLCRTLSCTLCKMENLQEHLADKYGIRPGEKTDDGMFSMELVECLGSCGTAPVMRVNDVYCENMTTARVDEVIAACREGKALEEEPMAPH